MRSRFPSLLALASLTACTAATTTGSTSGAVAKELEPVRAATAQFTSYAQAEKAGYTMLFNGVCFADPTQGAMGYHYVNPQLLDATLDPLAPEAVLYEPQANGTLKLVGLEYVVPKAAWAGATAPTLFGQAYSFNEAFQLYTLHVWLYRDNPAGTFVGWNPTVTCTHAPASLTMEHHH